MEKRERPSRCARKPREQLRDHPPDTVHSGPDAWGMRAGPSSHRHPPESFARPFGPCALFLCALLFASSAHADRNSSGTYSLPVGNPVVTGTSISSTWANTTLSDIGTNITDSLSRSGEGAMLAPLQCTDGTVSLPSLTFATDLDTGLYRIGANNPGMSVNGALNQSWSTTTSTFALGLTVNNSTAEANGITVTTGSGFGFGIDVTGGTGGGHGLRGTAGGTDASGVLGYGNGAGAGVFGHGGATGPGGQFRANTAATGGTRQDALEVTNGDIKLSSVANATSTTSISERLTPSNIVKAWAHISTANGATPTINDGFNVTSASCATNDITVTIAGDFASGSYAVTGNLEAEGFLWIDSTAAGTFKINAYSIGLAGSIDLCAAGTDLSFIAVGNQ